MTGADVFRLLCIIYGAATVCAVLAAAMATGAVGALVTLGLCLGGFFLFVLFWYVMGGSS